MNKNASFQLIMRNDGTYLQLIPEKSGGMPLIFTELDEYLCKRHIEYDKLFVGDTISNLYETKVLKLDNIPRREEAESVSVSISADHMTAIGRFYPPSQNGDVMTKNEIINDLVKAGVKYGVIEQNLNAFLQNRVYFQDIVLAKGTPCVEGKDAKIIYYFNTDLSKKPKVNDDGTVDFHQLDTICHINKGDLIASLKPAIPGKPGINVCGSPISPAKVVHKILRHGNKIHLSEDGEQMFSDVDGHVVLIDDKVFVSDSFEVPADVDTSTGDIVYDGNVIVKGSVRTGYKVVANGDIIVEGVVEGAILEAGGQIILKRGIQGMNKGILKANSNIVTKFIENAMVSSGGYVTTEAILHSKVSAKGDIIASGKKGFITGGEIRSGSMISVKTAGSTMGTNTLLEVGVDPVTIEEYRKIERELPAIDQELERLNQNLILYLKKIRNKEKLSQDKLILIKTMSINKEQLDKKKQEKINRMQVLQEFIDNHDNGCIKVSDSIFPGCKVVISNIVYYVRNELSHCMLVRDQADVRVTAL